MCSDCTCLNTGKLLAMVCQMLVTKGTGLNGTDGQATIMSEKTACMPCILSLTQEGACLIFNL